MCAALQIFLTRGPTVFGIVATNLHEAGMAAPSRDDETDARLERLLERYASLLRSLIARHCPRDLGLQIGDIEQDARFRLWRALQREKELSDPASYIHRIAVTATIDAVRRVLARREDQLYTAEGGDEESIETPLLASSPANSPEAVTQRREMMERVGAAVAALPDNRRRAVELHLQGLALGEIAELLGWTEGKARNLVYRGLDDLREALRREGIDYE
jgi:RNA polymerase sigma-70 factor (ECF subfamily)